MSTEPTVFVVDPDEAIRQSVWRIAESMGLGSEVYGSGLAFLDGYDRNRQGCLVLAVRILDVSGPQIQRRLLAEKALIPVIFAAKRAPIPVVVRTMKDGAVDFLEKPFLEQDMWEAIQRALRLDQSRRRLERWQQDCQSRLARLTEKEHDVLDHIIEGKRNRDIAAASDLSVRTVELRRARLMQKLCAQSVTDLVRIVASSKTKQCIHFNTECRDLSEPNLWPAPVA